MTNGDRLDRVERMLEQMAATQMASEQAHKTEMAEIRGTLVEIRGTLAETAARQQYHDEAFERFDAEMSALREAISTNTEHIRGLARIAEIHHLRLERLEGGEPT